MGDLISKQAVLDLFHMKYSDKELYKAIYELPSVEKKGEWIKTYPEYEDWNTYECSCCCEEFCLIEGTPYDNGYNFCPNCGADMRGE